MFTLIATYQSPVELGAQTIMRAIGLMTFMVPVGISTACAILVGRSIGQGAVAAIKKYYKLCLAIGFAISIIQILILIVVKDFVLWCFTSNFEII